jgi:hypothetical protein
MPPDVSDCDAIEQKPLPPMNRRSPTGATRTQSRIDGSAAPRRRPMTSITLPATMNRIAPENSGGSSTTTMRIARYVELQIR